MPQDHPLLAIRQLTNSALDRLSVDFAAIYADIGRPSIAPEKLLRALLLQAFFSVRSERQLMEQISYNMLFRWFVGLDGRAGMGRDRVHQEPRPAAGDRIRELRKAKGYTLDKLAELAESNKSYTWELENKSPPRPSADKVVKIDALLGVMADYLIDATETVKVEDATDAAFCDRQRQESPDGRFDGRR